MKRFFAMAMLVATTVLHAETAPPSHSAPPANAPRTSVPSEAQKQAKLFQLVNACLAERGVSAQSAGSAGNDILKKLRGLGN